MAVSVYFILNMVHQSLLSISLHYIYGSKIKKCGVQQGPWIINLLKHLTSNLSNNYGLRYILLEFGFDVSFEEGAPIFVVNYQVHIYEKKLNIVCLQRGNQLGPSNQVA